MVPGWNESVTALLVIGSIRWFGCLFWVMVQTC